MNLRPDGPDIPAAALEALEEGRLVLFCGAGISMPAGLPSFSGLVNLVYHALHTSPSPIEDAELSRQNYDRVLGLLEGEGRFAPEQVRRAVCAALANPSSPTLDTHRAILDLSRDRRGNLRLVTTNFDTLFEATDPAVPWSAAPLLPVPKAEKWNNLVYLHGRIDKDDPAGQRLVLTSGDFGIAYLVERWASRFVTELFNHFSVLFVGYQVGDPVMRYLIDALAAERRRGNRIEEAYAFTSYGTRSREEVEAEWRAKNIVPIAYNEADSHAALHETLRAWAGLWRGGLSSKRDIVREYGRLRPAVLSPERISQLSWAVLDSSGAMARAFADLKKDASLDWLAVFEKEGVLKNIEEGPPARASLCDHGETTRQSAGVGFVASALISWLASHADNPELARWVVGRGGHLHPQFAMAIRFRLDEHGENIASPLKKVWRALTGSVALAGHHDSLDHGHLMYRLQSETWSPELRLDLLSALAPRIAVSARWGSVAAELGISAEERTTPVSVSDILSAECDLAIGDLREEVLNRLRARPDYRFILADIAHDLTALLRSSMEMQAVVGQANSEYDLSHHQQPSISPHPQNQEFHGWTALIDLVRDSFDFLIEDNPALSEALIEVWRTVTFPLFRRLVLYAARKAPLLPGAGVFAPITSDPRHWLWAVGVQVELFRLLPMLWESFDDEKRIAFLQIVTTGPPRDLFRDDLKQTEWKLIRDRSVWEILVRLNATRCPLQGDNLQALDEIQSRHPEWRFTGEESENFPIWSETRWGFESDFSPDELLSMRDDELIRVLIEHQQNRAGLLDNWRQAAAKDQVRAVPVLDRLATAHCFDALLWRHSLVAFHEIGETASKEALLAVLEKLPENLLPDVVHPIASAITAIATNVSDSVRGRLLLFWDRVLPQSILTGATANGDDVTSALNHPTGILAEALLNVLRSRTLKRGEGIATDVRDRVERLLSIEGPPGRLARVIISSRVALFHDLDSSWTEQKLIRLFDWRNPDEARGAWRGYLWSPWFSPALWAALKDHFLVCFDHIGEIGAAERNLAQLVPAVAIEGDNALSADEAASCLRRVDARGRDGAAWWLAHKMANVGERASRLWRERVGPWLECAWPKEPHLRSPRSSVHLARAALLAGDAFPDAVRSVTPLLGAVEHGRSILDDIEKLGHIASHPAASLEVVDVLVGASPAAWFGDVETFLARVAAADPQLQGTPRFKRLKDLAVRQ